MKTQTPKPNNRSESRVDRPLVFLAVAVTAGLVLVLAMQFKLGWSNPASVNARADDEYGENRTRIEQMTEQEREQVQRKAKQYFGELNEDQRASNRKLHSNLNSAENGDELKETLKRFNTWLTSLTSFQLEELREKLRNAKTAVERREIVEETKKELDLKKWIRTLPRPDRERLARVKDDSQERDRIISEIREEQDRRLATGESTSPPSFRRRPGSRSGFGPRIKSAELENVLNVMAKELRYPAKEQQAIQALSPVLRHVRILHDLVSTSQETSRKGLLTDKYLVERFEESELESELKNRLAKFADAEADPRKGEYDLFRLLIRSTVTEQFSRYKKPDSAELLQFSQQLSREERQFVMRFRGDDLRRILEYKYSQKQREKSSKEFREFFKLLSSVQGFPSRFRPPSSRSGGSRTGKFQGPRGKPERGGSRPPSGRGGNFQKTRKKSDRSRSPQKR
jgi:hypothetical protein